jgi:hypothetical protein
VSRLPLDPAEELRFGDRRIVVRVHVTPGDQHAGVSAPLDANHAVGKQPRSPFEEDHVVSFHDDHVDRSDQQDVAGPDERQHARARDADPGLAAAAQQL